jgi:hypothetical protein
LQSLFLDAGSGRAGPGSVGPQAGRSQRVSPVASFLGGGGGQRWCRRRGVRREWGRGGGGDSRDGPTSRDGPVGGGAHGRRRGSGGSGRGRKPEVEGAGCRVRDLGPAGYQLRGPRVTRRSPPLAPRQPCPALNDSFLGRRMAARGLELRYGVRRTWCPGCLQLDTIFTWVLSMPALADEEPDAAGGAFPKSPPRKLENPAIASGDAEVSTHPSST